MNCSQVTSTAALNGGNALYNGATLTIYSGTQPTTPETALSGNTALAVFTFANPAFAAPTFSAGKETAAGSFVASSVSPAASGTASFARATLNATARVASTAYALGTILSNSGNYYLVVGAGTTSSGSGPTTSANGQTDGTAVVNYIGSTTGQGNVLADYTVGTTGTDIILGTTTITTGTNVVMSSFTQSLPAV